MPTLGSIDRLQRMNVDISGPSPANRMIIFSGTAVFNWHRENDDNWLREPLTIVISDDRNNMIWHDISSQRPPSERRFPTALDSVAVASLAAFRMREKISRDIFGFGVDRAWGFFPDPGSDFPSFGVATDLAIRGNDVDFLRVSFQLNILVRTR